MNYVIGQKKINKRIKVITTTELLIETKELLYAILNKYVLSQSQKNKLAEYYKYYDAKMEEEKVKKYQNEGLFKKNNETTEVKEEKKNVSLISYKENLFTRFFRRIKGLFKRYQGQRLKFSIPFFFITILINRLYCIKNIILF